jgi:fructokinase
VPSSGCAHPPPRRGPRRLICERPVASLTDADAFVRTSAGRWPTWRSAPRGGAPGSSWPAARATDAWGVWLHAQLEQEGVGSSGSRCARGSPRRSPSSPSTTTASRPTRSTATPSRRRRGARGAPARGRRSACDALFLTSNTLVGEAERALSTAARDRALELGRPVLFDPNLRLHRWDAPARAASEARALVKGAFLVKCNAEEARLLSGEDEPVAAAEGLLAMGAQHVVVTRGPQGALLRGGGLKLDVPGEPAEPISTVGAGDAFMGAIVAGLAATDFYAPAIAAALRDAVREGAAATQRWGALA